MPSTLPEGEVAPRDGSLPEPAVLEAATRPFGFYLHVPFCAARCGYCDFNTYTAKELGGGGSQASYAQTAVEEVRMARRVLGDLDRPVDTVFFGGGTPTLLPAEDLGRMLAAVRDEFGLAADAEVTTEANPESVDPAYLAAIREAGFNRVSFGMQSATPHVLQILDRKHTPGRALQAAKEATAAGFEHVNLDLIYGTPGESLDDWRTSLESALSAEPDHVSAYALIVEDGTQLARRVRRGELPMPDDDDLADKYLLADELLSGGGLDWYEVSNWARTADARCRHNELYWRGDTWWGIGPGAHSHVGGVRWWNVKHPSAYADRLAAGDSPAYAREVLDEETRRVERVLLEIRLSAGLPVDVLDKPGQGAARLAIADELLVESGDRLVLTQRGRLLADAVVRDLLP
ncbi:oxygen-independent coproporphyrinogen-3 oxidase [Kribbella orskensis]|uniref:Heme chaperone HemW n=1 Tax=Kribbella orskensis TaxID=2512216 RepID=A0ABY2BBM8_9ACTN|nr:MULTISPECIES: radical SAM family heme chaperone HemW [Kribbella]TCN34283.1 oxygen-independent coproporphyrinogen-3 oxidase [Kribbella sp. VKM Ac-2500]TCO14411.1 oxygen-independent coproporphyrinogen-3 oxidase [Kribbella orskensis]